MKHFHKRISDSSHHDTVGDGYYTILQMCEVQLRKAITKELLLSLTQMYLTFSSLLQ